MNLVVRHVTTNLRQTAYMPDNTAQGANTHEVYVTVGADTYAISIEGIRTSNSYTTAVPSVHNNSDQYLMRIASALESMNSSTNAYNGAGAYGIMKEELEWWKIRCGAYERELRDALDKLARLE